MTQKFVLTLCLHVKQSTLRFDMFMTPQCAPHFIGKHMNTCCDMPTGMFGSIAGLKLAQTDLACAVSSSMLEHRFASTSLDFNIPNTFL